MSVRIRQLVKVTISGYLDFLYILVSFMKGKHQKNFFWKILFHTGLIACWSCAGRHSFVGNCSESEIWKKFSDEAQTCTLYNVCLKDDQKSWNVPKYVVVKASLEPTPQKLWKTKVVANFRQIYLPMPSLPYWFFLVDLIGLMTVSNFIIH